MKHCFKRILIICLFALALPAWAGQDLILLGIAQDKHQRKPAILIPSTSELMIRGDAKAHGCNNTFVFYNRKHNELITTCLSGKFGTHLYTDQLNKYKRGKTKLHERHDMEDFLLWFADWNEPTQQLCLIGKLYGLEAPLRLVCFQRNAIGKGFSQQVDFDIDKRFLLVQNLMFYKNRVVIAGYQSDESDSQHELIYDPVTNKLESWKKAGYERLVGRLNAGQLVVFKKHALFSYNLQTQTPLQEIPGMAMQRIYGQQPDNKYIYANSNGLREFEQAHADQAQTGQDKGDQHNAWSEVEKYDQVFYFTTLGYSIKENFVPSSAALVDLQKFNIKKLCRGVAFNKYAPHGSCKYKQAGFGDL